MRTESMLGDVATRAAQTIELMNQMRALLDASMDPDRMALRHLGVDRMGWTRLAYCEEAFHLWSELSRREPERFQTLHHLAIMHHARALDLEAGPEPAKSNDDWKTALEYWSRLSEQDAFWNYLADVACRKAKRDGVDELRRKIPELLLQIHYDIALAEGTKHYRTEFHIKMVKDSKLPDSAKTAVQRDSYTRFISRVPDAVWQINTLDPAVIKHGMDAITEFLSIDAGCIPALEDAVRLQVRLLRARHTELQAAGEDITVRSRLLSAMQCDTEQWRPYFDQLLPQAAEIDEEVRPKLAMWYRIMGDVLEGLDRHEEAIGFYSSGMRIAPPEDDELRRCTNEYGEAQAYVARERAHKDQPDAKAYCDRVRGESGLTVTARLWLANAYMLLHEFDTAEAECRIGIAIEPDLTDLDAIEKHERNRERLTEMLKEIGHARKRREAHQLIDAGQAHMQEGRFHEAVAAFNTAKSIVPDEPAVHYFRAQAYLGLDEPGKAQEDAREFVRILPRDAAKELRAAATKLEADIKEILDMMVKFGKQAPKLRREAGIAYKAEQYSVADTKLKEAIAQCPAKGRHELECELSIVLANWAVKDINNAGFRPTLSTLQTSEQRLQEAIRLDPSNRHAANNMEALQRIMTAIAGPRNR